MAARLVAGQEQTLRLVATGQQLPGCAGRGTVQLTINSEARLAAWLVPLRSSLSLLQMHQQHAYGAARPLTSSEQATGEQRQQLLQLQASTQQLAVGAWP
jgi:hypothetical protein